jgi:hypothetical protein
MNNSQIVREAWRLAWRHKYLWVLGFLASFFNYGTQALMASAGQEPAGAGGAAIEPAPLTAVEATMVIVGLGSVVVMFVLLWLVDMAAGAGLYHAVNELDEDRPVGLWPALATGIRCLPRLVTVTILLYLPLVLLPILALAVGFMAEMSVAGGADLVLLAAAGPALLYLFVMLLALEFAQRAIVLERRSVLAAIRYAKVILMTKFGTIVGLAAWVFLYSLPLLLLMGVFTAVNDTFGSLVAIMAAPVFAAFQSASFTLLFRQWMRQTVEVPLEEIQLALA